MVSSELTMFWRQKPGHPCYRFFFFFWQFYPIEVPHTIANIPLNSCTSWATTVERLFPLLWKPPKLISIWLHFKGVPVHIYMWSLVLSCPSSPLPTPIPWLSCLNSSPNLSCFCFHVTLCDAFPSSLFPLLRSLPPLHDPLSHLMIYTETYIYFSTFII